MRVFLTMAFMLVLVYANAQRKMPDLSFAKGSTEFANANRSYDDYGQFADTLKDADIVKVLGKILHDNEQLSIELGGHTAIGEDTLLAIQRAEKVKLMLTEMKINRQRITVKGYAHRQPVISDATLLKLSSAIEREAANQRNRRVEVKVIGVE